MSTGDTIEQPQKQFIGIAVLFILCFFISKTNLLALYISLGLDRETYSFALQIAFINIVFVVLYPFLSRQTLTQLGLRSPSLWSSDEKRFFLIGLVISNGCFLLLTSKWQRLLAFDDLLQITLMVLIPMLFWGFFQEMVYRGLLQNQLSKKVGSTKAILISNLLFTFGPLHFHHYQYVADNIAHMKYFAFIFVMGLFFAWVYKRFNNLWLAGLFHGIGNVYLDSINTATALFG